MKKVLVGTLAIILIAAFLLMRSFSAQDIPLGPPLSVQLPENRSPASLSLNAISAGTMLSTAGFAYRGGDMNEKRVYAMGGVLVQHPQGTVLIDAGFGRNVAEHFLTTPWLMQKTAEIESGTAVVDQLANYGVTVDDLNAVILTHSHWDHVSGLEDLPGVPVWVTQAEFEFVNSESEHTILARQFGTENYQVYDFDDGGFLGFSRSHDVYGDGSIVVVPAAGHTPGAVIVFVTLADDTIYAFIGDLAWQKEGIDLPAEKPWLARSAIGEDRAAVLNLLVHMHKLQDKFPQLQIVPSHDMQAWQKLPSLSR